MRRGILRQQCGPDGDDDLCEGDLKVQPDESVGQQRAEADNLIEARIGSTDRWRGSGRAVNLLHDASLHGRIWNEVTNPFRRENGRIGEPMLFARGSRGFGKPSFDARRSA